MKKLQSISKNLSGLVLVVLCTALLSACCHCKIQKSIITQWCSQPYSEFPSDSSIILWRKPGVSHEAFERWKREHHLPTGQAICSFCGDDDLELYNGVNIELLGGTGGTTTCTTGTICKPHGGGDDVAEFCYNIPIKIDTAQGGKYDTVDSSLIPSQDGIRGPVVDIAVFDTGIDPAIAAKYTRALAHPCNPSAALGWDFANGDNTTNDDFVTKHGSRVAKFIIDQVQIYHNQRVNIIPVKIFDANGNTSLFKVLCAFAYAQHSGIKIINASFGFYWHDLHNPPALFCDYIKTHLTDHGILLIASAGNRDLDEDAAVITSGLVSSGDIRNLKKHPCYPAALAGRPGYENVVTVTTVFSRQDKVSPQQNYSKALVDIGTDGIERCMVQNVPDPTEEYCFKDPLEPVLTATPISGSSFAAPIITGRITAFYDILTAGMGSSLNKATLIARMQSKNLVATSTGTVIPSHIKGGVYAPKAP